MLYKNVRRLEGGRRVSQFATQAEGHCEQQLDYKPNAITKAPERSLGIFCYSNLKGAHKYVEGNTHVSFTGIVEIHEATPAQDTTIRKAWAFPHCVRLCTAIRLGKTVARVRVVNGRPVLGTKDR